ncbi:MAG: hypothetical protein QXL69_01035 [Candidatus Bathyarchaeia archaeon]|nr:hypothetical protein [Candidatus Bathyarchaeota archaeon]
MGFCTVSDVKTIVNTNLSDNEINSLIALSDAEIIQKTGIENPQGQDIEVFRKLSMLKTAILIRLRDPHAIAIGSYRETHWPIPIWQGEYDRLISRYIIPIEKSIEYKTEELKERWEE